MMDAARPFRLVKKSKDLSHLSHAGEIDFLQTPR
jgi:hypothetical protein